MQRRGDGVVEVVMVGHQTGRTIEATVFGVRRELASGAAKGVFFDASGITGFSPDVRGPGVELLQTIKASGLPRAVAVVSSGAVRMMAAAISFAAGLPLDIYGTRAEAEHRLEQALPSME